jgi:hypothetical protein
MWRKRRKLKDAINKKEIENFAMPFPKMNNN